MLAGHVIWLKPDVFTFSVMLEGLGASKQWLQACAIAHELRQAALNMDDMLVTSRVPRDSPKSS